MQSCPAQQCTRYSHPSAILPARDHCTMLVAALRCELLLLKLCAKSTVPCSPCLPSPVPATTDAATNTPTTAPTSPRRWHLHISVRHHKRDLRVQLGICHQGGGHSQLHFQGRLAGIVHLWNAAGEQGRRLGRRMGGKILPLWCGRSNALDMDKGCNATVSVQAACSSMCGTMHTVQSMRC